MNRQGDGAFVYSNLAEKAINITSLEEIIQKANSVEISNNVVTAIYQEKSKEIEVSIFVVCKIDNIRNNRRMKKT